MNHSREYWYIGSMLAMSATQKNRICVFTATGIYLLLTSSISFSVCSATTTLACNCNYLFETLHNSARRMNSIAYKFHCNHFLIVVTHKKNQKIYPETSWRERITIHLSTTIHKLRRVSYMRTVVREVKVLPPYQNLYKLYHHIQFYQLREHHN